MSRRATCGNYVIKILAFLGSLACYVLMFGFWKSFETRYHRLTLSLIFPGYSATYIAFTTAVLCGQEIDRALNRVIAMLGVGAYWGGAAACWLHFTQEKKGSGNVYTLAAGAVAAFQALLLTVDFMYLLKDQTPPKSVETSKTKVDRLKVKSDPPVPEANETALNSAHIQKKVENVKPKVTRQSPQRRSAASTPQGQRQLK